MIITQSGLMNISNTFHVNSDPYEYFENAEKAKIKAEKDKITLLNKWKYILYITIILGFGGALLMLYNFLANLVGMNYWPS